MLKLHDSCFAPISVHGHHNKMRKILFVTRKYPPKVGGMEKYSYELYNALKRLDLNITLFANSKGNKHLPFFLLHLICIIFFSRNKYSHIHFADGLLAPFAFFAQAWSKAKTSITVHGLDITYDKLFYQYIIPPIIKKISTVVCDSMYGVRQCLERGVATEKCLAIPIGISLDKQNTTSRDKQELPTRFGTIGSKKIILASVGRLVPRKGFVWFVRNVMPLLDNNYVYLVAGSGPENNTLTQAIKEMGLEARVYLLDGISDNDLDLLYTCCDLFVMPNIRQQNDPEGFGIVALEAAMHGTPVLASRLEGIQDAVVEGSNGFFAESGNAGDFAEKVLLITHNRPLDREHVAMFTQEHFSADRMAARYAQKVFK